MSLRDDPQAFRSEVIKVDIGGELRSYGQSLTPRQCANHAAIDPALKLIAGRGPAEGVGLRHCKEETRGCAKSTGSASDFLFLLTASDRKIEGVHAACDKEQAALLLGIIESMVKASSLLSQLIVVEKGKVWNRRTGSTLTIISSDVASSFGHLVDFVSIDEIAVWGDDKRRLWGSLISTAGKKARCLVTVTTNAGFRSSWQFVLREKIRTDPDWVWTQYTSPPEWMTERAVQEQKRLLMPPEFARLLAGEWLDDDGTNLDSFDIDRSIVLDGPAQDLPAGLYGSAIGLDMANVHDAAAIVCIGWDVWRQKLRLLDRMRWLPRDFADGRIRQETVKAGILEFRRRFRATAIKCDGWQSIKLMQELVETRLFTHVGYSQPNAGTNDAAAKAIVRALRERTLELFECGLVADMRKAQVVERVSGVKLVFPKDEFGHCDEAAALQAIIVDMLQDLPILLQQERAAAAQMSSPYWRGQPIDCTQGGRWGAAESDLSERIHI